MESVVRYQAVILVFFQLYTICTCSANSLFLKKKGDFMYGNFLAPVNGSVLRKNDAILLNMEVANEIECHSQCVRNPFCLSVNYGVESKKEGKVKCELLNWGATDYRSHLIKKDGFFHARIQTICSTSPCIKGTYCFPQLNNEQKPFSCFCTKTSQECINGNIRCNALGVESGTITNSQMTASSQYSASWAPHRARLNKNYNWVPTSEDKNNHCWLQVDFAKSTVVTGVATQGRHDEITRWTKTYQLNYTIDDRGYSWKTYEEDGSAKTFQGNVNNFDVVKNELNEPFVARMVRIVPKLWYGAPALRIELYGC